MRPKRGHKPFRGLTPLARFHCRELVGTLHAGEVAYLSGVYRFRDEWRGSALHGQVLYHEHVECYLRWVGLQLGLTLVEPKKW